jgi:hypothetical protein
MARIGNESDPVPVPASGKLDAGADRERRLGGQRLGGRRPVLVDLARSRHANPALYAYQPLGLVISA